MKAAVAATASLLLALSLPLWSGVSYVVPRGASMEPRVSNGDLAVVRSHHDYRIGDIAAYRNATLHRVVVHRIVAAEGGVYRFKGDANSFVDPQQVRRADIVGRVAVSLPFLGRVLLWLTSPLNALLLMALVVLLVRERIRIAPATALPQEARQSNEPQKIVLAEPPEMSPRDLPVDSERLITIRDMSFPHELAVAEVLWPESMLALAERYDRPVLYDETSGELFVVESSMLFRCVLEQPAAAPVPLSLVRDVEPTQAPVVLRKLVDDLPAAVSQHAGAEPVTERERRHNWPRRRDYGGRRMPSPYGRDWAYAAGK